MQATAPEKPEAQEEPHVRFTLRLPKRLRDQIQLRARLGRRSLNQEVVRLLEEAAQRQEAEEAAE